jgi:biotin-dependent carboxylase-like uncharacterized protein
MIEVVDPGPLTTVQDRGRPGLAHLGVPPSGAVDPRALALANALVRNLPGAAVLEATLVGPRLRFERPTLVALAGACEPRAFETTELEPVRCDGGARVYVAVRGGIDVAPVLGSRSTDLLTGLGPPPLRAGDRLAVGPEPARAAPRAEATRAPALRTLRVVPGPREDRFGLGAVELLCTAEWRVTPASNRVGVRLDGPELSWASADELRSEGLVTGALQVPSAGRPILLLNDHPTTGGYPVIAVVCSEDLPHAGQLAPGDTVRFAAGCRSGLTGRS